MPDQVKLYALSLNYLCSNLIIFKVKVNFILKIISLNFYYGYLKVFGFEIFQRKKSPPEVSGGQP